MNPVLAARLCRIACYGPIHIWYMLGHLDQKQETDIHWNKWITLISSCTTEELEAKMKERGPTLLTGPFQGVQPSDIVMLPTAADPMAVGIVLATQRIVLTIFRPTQSGSGWYEDARFSLTPWPFVLSPEKDETPPLVHQGFLDMYTDPGLGTGELTCWDYWCSSWWCGPRGRDSWSALQTQTDQKILVESVTEPVTAKVKAFALYPRSLLASLLKFRRVAAARLRKSAAYLGEPIQSWVTGMSLGGALGALSCIHPTGWDTTLVTFGAPAIGNEGLQRLIQRHVQTAMNFVNLDDPVPHALPKLSQKYGLGWSLPIDPKTYFETMTHRSGGHQWYVGVNFFCSQQKYLNLWILGDEEVTRSHKDEWL